MNKKKRWIYQMGAFLIPILILTAFLFSKNNSFKGLLISDANAQYSFLFQYLKEVLNGTQSLFYNFAKGMGGAMYGTFFYYLSSPLNLLLIFVPDSFVIDFMCVLMVIKIGLSGFTMFYYLKKKNNHDFINFILSLSYALMSYNIMYYFNIMWLDAIYLTPLVVLGVDRILENKKSGWYIFFLFLTIISNYYIGYMVCIFLIIYMVYNIFEKYSIKKEKKLILAILKKFIISSTLAALLASFMILPVLNELKDIVRIQNDLIGNTLFSRITKLLLQFGIQKQSTKILYEVPYFFCGYFVFISLANYFLSKNNDLKKKKVCILFVFLGCCIIFEPLEFIWHGFIQPILLNYRYCFLISFFLIVMVSEKYDFLRPLNGKKIAIFTFGYIVMLTSVYGITGEAFNIYVLLLNVFFCLSNFLLINILLKNNYVQNKISILSLFILEVIVTLIFNFFTLSSFNINTNKIYYVSNELTQNLKTELNKFINLGYRVDSMGVYSINELFNTNYSRPVLFLSTVNGKIAQFLKNSGYIVGSSEMHGNVDQDVMNSFLGIRYWYGNMDSQEYQKIGSLNLIDEKENIYINENAYPIGYLINQKNVKIENKNVFTYQNSFFKAMGKKELFKRLDMVKIGNNKYKILTNKNEKYAYLQISSKNQNNNNYCEGKIIFDNKRIPCSRYGIFKIKFDDSKENHILEINDTSLKFSEVNIYKLDRSKWEEIVKEDKNQKIEFTKIEKNKLEFKIHVNSKNKDLLLTLPYEKGWSIFVDNKKVKYGEFFDTFITFPLSSGKHHVKMNYVPPFLKIGTLLSILSLLFTLYYVKR